MEGALLIALGGSVSQGSMLGAAGVVGNVLRAPGLLGWTLEASSMLVGGIGVSPIGGCFPGAALPYAIGIADPVSIVAKFIKMIGSDSESDTETNLFDVLPIISQAKSCFQLIFGSPQDALDTQRKFFSKCPILAQIKSFNELVDGEIGKAWRTQKEFFAFWFDTAVSIAEGVPLLGHFIGALAFICGNKEYGAQCMKSASRTAGVILGAAVGTFFGGPVGAAVGAVGGGLIMDLVITGIESAIRDTYTPSGHLAALDKILKGNAKAGDVFDILCGIGIEAGAAYMYAKQSARVRSTVFNERQIDSEQVRFSQTSVKGQHVDTMTEAIKNNQQRGRMDFTMPALDVVEMPDGQLTSLDNRRLLAAREANARVFARVVEGDMPVPTDQSGRFAVNGQNPEVMSEAVRNRVAQQRPGSVARANPNGFQDCPRKTYGGPQVPGGNFRPEFFRHYAGPISEVITAFGNIFTPRNRPRD